MNTSNATEIPTILFLSKYNHFENWKWPNFRMDAPGFEPWTLSIGLMIDWHINPLSHHVLVILIFLYKIDPHLNLIFMQLA